MVDERFLNQYRESIYLGEDDYSLIDDSIIKPIKEDYSDWDNYWTSHIKYMKEKYRYTYGSKAKKK